ncbi:MAG: hypothetical protein KF819_17495 [Labilithrix sp.]|nr:hypothetical protein [Labilithrix sp.]
MITGNDHCDLVNAARVLDADLILKGGNLVRLLHHTLDRIDRASRDPFEGIVRRAAEELGLSARETSIVDWFVRGGRRREYLARAGISRTTFDTERARLLEKTGEESVEDLAARLVAAALRGR